MGQEVALRGALAGPQAGVSAPPAPPLLLASRSPQRRAILEQLAIPFEVVVPAYEEEVTGADPVAEVERHAQGKARSVARVAGDRPVLGVDTDSTDTAMPSLSIASMAWLGFQFFSRS